MTQPLMIIGIKSSPGCGTQNRQSVAQLKLNSSASHCTILLTIAIFAARHTPREHVTGYSKPHHCYWCEQMPCSQSHCNEWVDGANPFWLHLPLAIHCATFGCFRRHILGGASCCSYQVCVYLSIGRRAGDVHHSAAA